MKVPPHNLPYRRLWREDDTAAVNDQFTFGCANTFAG